MTFPHTGPATCAPAPPLPTLGLTPAVPPYLPCVIESLFCTGSISAQRCCYSPIPEPSLHLCTQSLSDLIVSWLLVPSSGPQLYIFSPDLSPEPHPTTSSTPLPVWVIVGSTPASPPASCALVTANPSGSTGHKPCRLDCAFSHTYIYSARKSCWLHLQNKCRIPTLLTICPGPFPRLSSLSHWDHLSSFLQLHRHLCLSPNTTLFQKTKEMGIS